jgi:hypothetical protein
MNPNEIPSVMLIVKGIMITARKDGMASVISSQSINFTHLIIRQPTMISGGAMTG